MTAALNIPTLGETTLKIQGMSCASCVGRVERQLAAVPGVASTAVNLATERAVIKGTAAVDELISAIASVGYSAKLVQSAGASRSEDKAQKEAETQQLWQRFRNAALLSIPVVVLAMGTHLSAWFHELVMATLGTFGNTLIQAVLTTLVLVGPGRIFFSKGLPALLRGAPDMNSLVAIGSLAAWGFSMIAFLLPGLLPAGTVNIYFEAAAVIVTLILLGRLLEARAKGHTSDAIKRLIGLQPKTARVKRGSAFEDVRIDDVIPGDLIEIRPGERVPVDGVVTDGASWVDESMMTGEPTPVAKQAGAQVIGGTMNLKGAITFRARAVGEATMLAQIIRMVEDAQGGKLPIQALVDRISMRFVPAVMLLAALTFVGWVVFAQEAGFSLGLVNAIAVLIVACPCAMGLATPTSIMVGTGRGAELGVLLRSGGALQTLQDVRIVGFDKTGTLTEGQPQLTDMVLAPGFERGETLAMIAAIETKSEHPVAQAIVAAGQVQGLPEVRGFQSLTGLGVSGLVHGKTVHVGSDRLMTDLGVDFSSLKEEALRLADQAKTPMFAAVDGQLAAVLAVADPIKPSAKPAIAALQRRGVKVAMITGDNARTAQAIANALGIDRVISEVQPSGKLDEIRKLKALGVTAYVGDGINDAPALAEADVGIAIGTGTDVAIEAAGVVLMSGRLSGVTNAIALSHAVMRNVKQNLFWAFAYNVALIPVAAGLLWPAFGILLSPVLAAGAMTLSSVFVLTNALRLRRFSPAVEQTA